MNYEYLWKVLEELIVELKNKGVTVPQELVDDLKSTQTLINIYRTDPSALEITTDIEFYLEKIESNLIYLANTDISEEYADECLKRVSEARIKGLSERPTVKPSFVSGIPKGDHWVRIEASNLISNGELGELIEKLKLSSKSQENGRLLIYGEKENLKTFIREVSKIIRKRKDSS